MGLAPNLGLIDSLDEAQVAAAMTEVAAVTQRLGARLWKLAADRAARGHDELLTVEEAAARLKVSPQWLRRRRLGCEVPLSSGAVRWSARGLERWIDQRTRAKEAA